MASPNQILIRDSYPIPKPIMVKEGNPNNIKRMQRTLKAMSRGNTRGKRNGKNRIITQEEGGVPPSTTE